VCSKIEDAGVEEDGDMVLVAVVKDVVVVGLRSTGLSKQ